jgi:hypothetical protein
MMEVRFGAPVDCSDGVCGILARVVVDRELWAVTHLVAEPHDGDVFARLVPIDLVAEAGARVRLTCTLAQWRELPYLEDVQFVDERASGSWGELLLWPLTSGSGEHDRPVVVEHLPPGAAEISEANQIRAIDGRIGRLEGVVIDGHHRLTLLLLREGHLWRRKEVAIPARSIEAVADVFHVSLSKDEIADLPANHGSGFGGAELPGQGG